MTSGDNDLWECSRLYFDVSLDELVRLLTADDQ